MSGKHLKLSHSQRMMNNFFTWSCVWLDCKVQNVTYSVHVQLYILLSRYWIKHNYCKLQTKLLLLVRAVKKFLSSRLIMNKRRLWNLYQRHKFLRAEASRDILKFKVSEMASPGVFKMYFPPWMPSGFVRIHMPLKCPRHSTKSHGSNVLFKYGFNVIQNWETDALQ